MKDIHVVKQAIISGMQCGSNMAMADLELLAVNPEDKNHGIGIFQDEYCQSDFEKDFTTIREAPASYKLFHDAAYRTYAKVFDLGWQKLLKFGKVGE
jgi:hypothetical protein